MCGPYFEKGALTQEWNAATKALDGYHIHIYGTDAPDGSDKMEILELTTKIRTLFPEHVKGIFDVGVVGPHAQANTEIEITKEGFGEIVSWLQMNATQSMSILIHPETEDVLKDHLDSAMWIGKPVAFNDNFFDRIKASQAKHVKKTQQP